MSELVEKFSPYVLGIDLGTSTSIASIYRKGKGEVLDIFGETVTPSVVNYREDSEPLVGLQAKRRALIDPDRTVVSIKRHMGDETYERKVGENEIKPEDVSALILEHIKNGAQECADLNGTIQYAVVTIPANFNNNQREATRKAGELAGLEILRLVEEPVAAAIAYGFGNERDQNILVYDLGGGTFDVCILKVEASEGANSSFSVLGKAGVPELGGDDFDTALVRMLADTIVAEGGPDVLDTKKDQGISKKKLRNAAQILKEQAETAKIELTEASSVFVDAPSLVKDESGKEFHLSKEVTRDEFNELIRPLVEQTGECINQALSEAKCEIDDIDRIILVGGSTRVPIIREMVTEMFGKEPYGDIDPATAVSQGAAIVGATFDLPGEKSDDDKIDPETLNETNTASHYLGIETSGQKFSPLIDKGAEIPAENKKIYSTTHDNQPELRLSVFQFPAETDVIDMNMPGCACLGEIHLGPLDPAPKGTLKVEVAFNLNEEGVLKISANSQGDEGISKDIEVKVS